MNPSGGLGCTFGQGVEDGLRRRGALIFPRLQGVPFDPYRARLYTPQEPYAGRTTVGVMGGHAAQCGTPDFANAIREAILLELCGVGIIFLPGAAGTVQEIFQDACENYYSAREAMTPMVLVGRRHWEHEYPEWPMLQRLAAGRAMEDRIFLVDSVVEALAVLGG